MRSSSIIGQLAQLAGKTQEKSAGNTAQDSKQQGAHYGAGVSHSIANRINGGSSRNETKALTRTIEDEVYNALTSRLNQGSAQGRQSDSVPAEKATSREDEIYKALTAGIQQNQQQNQVRKDENGYNTNNERDALLGQLRDFQSQKYLFADPDAQVEYSRQVKEFTDKLDAIDAQLGNPAQFYDKDARGSAVLSNWAKNFAGSNLEAVGTLGEFGREGDLGTALNNNANAGFDENAGYLGMGAVNGGVAEAPTKTLFDLPGFIRNSAKDASEGAETMLGYGDGRSWEEIGGPIVAPPTDPNQPKNWLQMTEAERSAAMRSRGGQWLDEAAEGRAKEREGLSKLQSFGLDIAEGGMDLAADQAANLIVPGVGMVEMGVRTFGSAAHEVAKNGGDINQQFIAGSKAAAIEIMTEKISEIGGVHSASGKGWIDGWVDNMIDKAAKHGQLAAFAANVSAAFGSEFLEEAISGVLNPIADYALNLSDNVDIDWGQVFYEGLIGGVLGIFGGVQKGVQYNAQQRAQIWREAVEEQFRNRFMEEYSDGTEQTETQKETPQPKTGQDALLETIANGQRPQPTAQDALLEAAGIMQNQQAAETPQNAQGVAGDIPAPQTGTESGTAAPVELNTQERPSRFIASVREKLKNLVLPNERKAVIDRMSFGEQVAAIENGAITASEKPFVDVSATTPQTLIDKAGAEQLPVIMSYENAYLSARDSGKQKGHYHDLGADIMSQIPAKMDEPLAIIRQKNGRIAEVLPLTDKQGKNIYAIVELNATKDVGGINKAYNLIISAFGAGTSYIQGQINKKGNEVIENNLPGATSQVNPQRIELPGTINEAATGSAKSILSSNENIPQPAPNSNSQSQNSGADSGTQNNLQNGAADDTLSTAMILAQGGATPSQVYNATNGAYVLMANGDIRNVETGEVTPRSAYVRQGMGSKNTPGRQEQRAAQAEVSADDGRRTDSTYQSESGRIGFEALTGEQQERVKQGTIELLEATESDEVLELLEAFNDDAALVERIYQSYVDGTLEEEWVDRLGDVTGLQELYDSMQPQVDHQSGEAQAISSTSNSEVAGNDGSPPITSEGNSGSAPVPAGAKLSQFWTNTLTKAEEKVGAPDRVKQPLWYMPKSEVQSLAEASARLNADAAGEVEKLVQAEAWSGVQTDMASQLANQFYHEGRETGDMSGYMAWRKVMQNHITETARGLQAVGKYSRATAESIVSEATDALNDSEISAEEKAQKLNDISDFADAYEKAVGGHESGTPHTESEIQALKDLILSINEYRRTGTFIKKNFEKLVDRINDGEYLDRFVQRQMLAITSDARAKPSDNIGGKVKATQVLMQLTSIATIERNLAGNFVFGAIDTMTGNTTGFAIDTLVSKFTGKKTVGFDKGWFSSTVRSSANDAMLRSALEIAADVDLGAQSNKFDTAVNRAYKMSGGPVSRFFSRWEQGLGYALTSTDRLGRGKVEGGTTEALERLKNSNLTQEEIAEIAKQDADYRLFQNKSDNWKDGSGRTAFVSKGAHDFLNLFGFGGKVNGIQRTGGFGVGDLLMPYPGVPANLGVKLLEHSPLNTAKGLAELAWNAKKGTLDAAKQHQAVMDISRGLTGTALIAAFAAIAKSGALRDFDDEDDYDVMAQNAAEGKRGLQWNVTATLEGRPNNWRDGDMLISAAFMEPVDAFLRTGVMIANEDEKNIFSMGGDILQAASQSIMDLPVMSSISNIEDTIRYSTSETPGGKFVDAAATFAGDAVGGFIPAPIRHLANATDSKARDTTSNSKPRAALNRILSNIPGLRETLDVKTDAFGQEISNGSAAQRAANVVLPGRVDTISQSRASAAVEALIEATGKKSLMPDRKGPKSLDIGGETVKLTDEQSREYKETLGAAYSEAVEALLRNKTWGMMSEEAQVKTAQDIIAMSRDAAKMDVAKRNRIEYESDWADERALRNPATYLAVKNMYSLAASDKNGKRDYKAIDALLKASGRYTKLDEASKALLQENTATAYLDELFAAHALGIDAKAWFQAKDQQKAINAQDLTSTQKAVVFSNWLDNQSYTDQQKQTLQEQMGFYSQVRGDSDKYDSLVDSGLSSDNARNLYDAIYSLPILEGSSGVKNAQKYRAINDASYLSEAEKWAALEQYGTEAAIRDAKRYKTYAEWIAANGKYVRLAS